MTEDLLKLEHFIREFAGHGPAIMDSIIGFEVKVNHSHIKLNDNQVVIEKLPDKNGKIVRHCITIKLSSNNNFMKQRCLVCDKFLTEIKPKNGTKIRIKCKGCLVVNEITYSII